MRRYSFKTEQIETWSNEHELLLQEPVRKYLQIWSRLHLFPWLHFARKKSWQTDFVDSLFSITR